MSDWCRVVLAGGRVLPDGESDGGASPLFGLDGLSIQWGRDNAVDQPAATTVSLAVVMGDPPWPDWTRSDLLAVGAALAVTCPPWPDAATGAGVVAFARVTDVTLAWDDAAGCAVASITAVDHLGQLESEPLGDDPWPVEAIAARLARVAALTATGVTFEIPPSAVVGGLAQDTLAATLVAAQDVDAEAAAAVVQDLGVAGDAAAWPVYGLAADGQAAPLIWLRSNDDRFPLLTLHIGGSGSVIVGQPIDPYAGATDWARVSACWIDRNDAAWTRSASTLITRATIGWVDASTITPEEPDPTIRGASVIDVALEQAQGVHGVSYDTALTTAAEASTLATRVILRAGLDQWLTDGLRIDQVWIDPPGGPVYGDTAATLARLLASPSRAACPVLVGDLPPWVPLPAESAAVLLGYLEGGTYTFVGGRWILDLRLSSAGGGGAGALWQDVPPDVPAWSWDNVDPSVRWLDTAVPVED
jgi:hypothetical protein